jgi:hypothetical protein
LGFAELAANTYDGKRYWSSNSYEAGTNVTTWVQIVAEKIIFEGKRATGVQVSHSTGSKTPDRVTVFARKEILVTSGVQGSAKLLLLRYVITPRVGFMKLTHVQAALDLTTSFKGIVSLKFVTYLLERTIQIIPSSRLFGNFETVDYVWVIYRSSHPNVIGLPAFPVTGWLGIDIRISSTGLERTSWINLLSTGFWLKESLILKALPCKTHP